MVHNMNVFLESESPLIITGVSPGVTNYLEFETFPVNMILQKYSSTKLNIQGELFSGTTNCIILRVLCWKTKERTEELIYRYPVNKTFDITSSFAVLERTLSVTPRIGFENSSFSEGQKIIVKEFRWH